MATNINFQEEYLKKNSEKTFERGKILGINILIIYTLLLIFRWDYLKTISLYSIIFLGAFTTVLFLIFVYVNLKKDSKSVLLFFGLTYLGVSISINGFLFALFSSTDISDNLKYEFIILYIAVLYGQSVFSYGIRKYLYLIQFIPLIITFTLLLSFASLSSEEWFYLGNLPLFALFIFIANRYTEKNSFEDFINTYKIELNELELLKEIEKRKSAEADLKKHQKDLKQLVELRTQSIKEKSIELEVAKEKAEEADRLKTAFMATMSHELRTPLNAIIGFTELVDEKTSKDEILEYNDIINKSGLRLLNTVEDIFLLTYIETKKIKLFKKQFNLNNFIESLLINYKIEKENYHKAFLDISFKTEVDDKDCFVTTDSKKLKIIFDKLVNNAIKFTKIGAIELGYKIVNIKGDLQQFQFYVKDSGIGIAKEFHEVIFERFRQVEETNTRNYEGSGLGVTIACELTKLLGGKMWVESELEKGSTFYFQLPLEIKGAKKEYEKGKTQNKKAIPDYSGKRILIAEDTESNFKLLEQYLKRTNLEIIWAVDGLEAVEFCKQDSSIDLILMDMKMPNMNGYEATTEIKKMGIDCPVIAQTAYALQDDEVKTFTAGCDDYLSKPIKKLELYNCLNKYL